MKKTSVMASCLAVCLLAGCSTTTNTEDSSSDTQTKEPETLSALVSAADNDTDALAAWKTVLSDSATAYSNSYQFEGEGMVYEYKEDAEDFVDDNMIYDTARDDVLKTDGDALYLADLTQINDSYNTFTAGYGEIGNLTDPSILSAFKMDEGAESALKGTILSVDQNLGKSEDLITDNLIDAITDYGYVRNVDPIHNASLYDYDLTQDGDNYVLTLKVKDLDAFKKQAAITTELVDNLTDRPVLGLDEITEETYTFTFNSDGVLTETTNQVLHAISAMDHTTYVNLNNKATLKAAESNALNTDALSKFVGELSDGTYGENDTFTIEDWQ